MTGAEGTVGRSPVVRVAAPVGDERGSDPEAYGAARAAAGSGDDGVTVVRTGPVGNAAVEPLLAATLDGRSALVPSATAADARDAVAALADGRLPDAGTVVDHDPDTGSLPRPDTGPLSVGERRVLGPCGWRDPLAPADWPAVATAGETDLADCRVRGRGYGDAGDGDPVGETYAAVRAADGDPVVVVNANDTADVPRPDRLLLEAAPLAILDGVAVVADAVGASDAVVCVNETATGLQRHLRAAVDAAREADRTPVPGLVAVPDVVRAEEPTAALEALEGADRVEPRLQPPSPAEHGLYGRPTVVHTARTVAQVRAAVADGAVGGDADAPEPGTRLFTVAGDVDARATVEVGPDDALATARDAVGTTHPFKMACVGGTFGGITRDLDVAPTHRSLRAAGLGTDGVIELFDDRRCALATVGRRAALAAAENSGRCVPGREGTKQLAELLRDVYGGSLDGDAIRELGRVMARSANCRLGATAPRPVVTALDAFEPEFRAHANGRCPTDTCTEKL